MGLTECGRYVSAEPILCSLSSFHHVFTRRRRLMFDDPLGKGTFPHMTSAEKGVGDLQTNRFCGQRWKECQKWTSSIKAPLLDE